jgi:hypothetical protein
MSASFESLTQLFVLGEHFVDHASRGLGFPGVGVGVAGDGDQRLL